MASDDSSVPKAEAPNEDSGAPPAVASEPPTPQKLEKKAARSSMWTAAGFGLAQVLRLGSNVVLSRVLPPTAFGLMAMVNVVMTFLQQFSDMGIRPSIVRSSRGKDPDFLNTAWTVQVLRGSSLWGIAILAAWPLSLFYKQPILVYLLPIVGFTALCHGLMSTSMATLNRELSMGRLTILELSSQTLGIVVMINWALNLPSVWALAVGPVIGAWTAVTLSHTMLPGIRNRLRWEPEARKELFGFGRWLFLSTGLAFLMAQGDRLILSATVPVGVLGVYSAAVQISAVATGLLGQVSMKVLMPLYSRLNEQGSQELRRGVFRARLVMMAALFPVPALLVPFGDIMVRILLGKEFHDAGWMLQLLAIGAVVDALIVSIWPVILALGDSFRYMVQVIGRTVIVTAAMVIGLYLGDLKGLILGLAAGRLAGYPILIWAVRPTRTWFPLLDLAGLVYAAVLVWIGQQLLGVVEPFLLPFVAK